MSDLTEYNNRFKQPALDSPLTKLRFCNKIVIVAGGASGIGRATVERFCNDGAYVAIFDINTCWGKHLEEELLSQGKKAKFYTVDVTDEDRCVESVRAVADDNCDGVVNFLVNCCAYFGGTGVSFTETSRDTLRKSLDVNVVGASNMAKACFPFMKKAGPDACIVNISSFVGHTALPAMSSYSATKAAISMLTKSMALDLSSEGIRVNAVSPGFVWTPILSAYSNEPRGGNMEENVGRRCHMNVKGFIEAAGIASVIAFLCSRDAMYIDGADIPVDCGLTAMGPEGQGN